MGRGAWTVAAVLAIAAPSASAQSVAPLQEARIVEHVGGAIPRGLTFTDADGQRVTLDSMLGSKPLVVMLAYFTCPMLCQLGQDGAADAFKDSGLVLGRDFRAITVSIDPRDRPETAREWRDRAAARMGRATLGGDWRFVVGETSQVRPLADAVGFEYAYDPATQQYSHAAALFIVTPDGRIARYIYGISFDPATVAAALNEARANRIGGPVERFLLRCYHYVPALRQHAGFVTWLLRVGGLTVVFALGGLLFTLWRKDALRAAREETR